MTNTATAVITPATWPDHITETRIPDIPEPCVRAELFTLYVTHDGGFHAGDQVSIDGAPFAVALCIVDGANGIGSYDLFAGQILQVGYNNEEFYVSGMAISAVPAPAAIWLFGSARVGFVGFGRRRSIAWNTPDSRKSPAIVRGYRDRFQTSHFLTTPT